MGKSKNRVDQSKKKGVKISFYIRFESNNYKSWEQLEALDIKPKLIKGLHAKLYFNKQKGIVSTMNLLNSSNLSALEFGAIYDTTEEMAELKNFVKSYLSPIVEKEMPSDEEMYFSRKIR